MNRTRILLVEDERRIMELNAEMLSEMGFDVLCAKNISQGQKVLSDMQPDVIVLDIMLPDGSGLDLLKQLREAGNDVPVLLLTALGKTQDVVRGLQMGADDYLSKPYELEILSARVNALARRSRHFGSHLSLDELELDALNHRARLGNTDLNLTQKEFLILFLLVRAGGQYVSAVNLCENVWGHAEEGDYRALWKHISNLKTKLAAAGGGVAITGARGEGYRLSQIAD
jgi:DNA-binding response OmpR family regulator